MYTYGVVYLLRVQWGGDHCPSRHLLGIVCHVSVNFVMRMPCQGCLCCLCICPNAYARQYLSKLNLVDFECFGALDQMCFFGTAESFQF